LVNKERLKKICFLVLLFSLVVPTFSFASLSLKYYRLVREFKTFIHSPAKAKYRSNWLKFEKRFFSIYKTYPKKDFGARSLYYCGRVYQELGNWSKSRADYLKAIEYFRKFILLYPKHSWGDDAQLRIAKIYLNKLKDSGQAYIELLKVVYNYPKADMRPQAEELLKELDQKNKEKIQKSLPSAQIKKRSVLKKVRLTADSSKDLTKLLKIRHWSSDDYTRIVLDLKRPVKYTYHLLKPDPVLKTSYRLFIDLKGTTVGPDVKKEVLIADGILKKIRASQYKTTITRVVLDITSLKNYNVFSLQTPFRIVIDVYANKSNQYLAKSNSVKLKNKQKQKSSARIVLSAQERRKIARQNLIEQLGLRVKTIMLDAGHGGKDPGAISHGIKEKDINLKMVKILGRLLKGRGFRVLYTRTRDVFIPLEERTALANSKKADLFISIHCNANRDYRLRGLEVYYLNVTRSKDALRVAARENAVSARSISDLQLILTQLMLNSKISESRQLANLVRLNCRYRAKRFYRLFKDHGVRAAPFYVLMGAKMPAVLVELGYLTNPYDRKKLTSTSYLKRLALGMVDALVTYKKKLENIAGLDDWKSL